MSRALRSLLKVLCTICLYIEYHFTHVHYAVIYAQQVLRLHGVVVAGILLHHSMALQLDYHYIARFRTSAHSTA
jgi:hypothetical protein